MEDIQSFVDNARTKGLGDDKIKELLLSNGWSESQAEAALLGLTVPTPSTKAESSANPAQVVSASPGSVNTQSSSITALQAALQHVLLWLFTGTSTVMFAVVATALYGSHSGSSESLLTYVALELITFVPFTIIFWRYVRRLKSEPELTTGKVWSIITIVFHSLGLIGALMTFVLAIILVHNQSTTPALVAASAIGTMNILVLAAYVLANFSHRLQLKRKYLYAFPVALFVLIAVFGSMALTKAGPLRADEQKRQHLVDAVMKIRDYTDQHKTLPANSSQISTIAKDVKYEKLSSSQYQLCATFQRSESGGLEATDYYSQYPSDSYASEYQFTGRKVGENCWKFTSSVLDPQFNSYNDPGSANSKALKTSNIQAD